MIRFAHACGLLLTFSLLSATSVMAKPASPAFHTQILDDGSSLTYQLHGDENFHYSVSEDGFLLLKDKAGDFFFADENATISAHRATNTDKRNSTVKQFLASLDKKSIEAKYKSFAETDMARKPSASATVSRLPAASALTNGVIKGLVILVQFQDTKFTVAADPQKEFTNYMNESGYSNYGMTGSARDFFVENSNGVFNPTFEVYGPVTLKYNAAYYGQNDNQGWDANAEAMVLEAVKALDATVDYTKYDNDNDGTVDFVYVFYAGLGEADGGTANTIWPHASKVAYSTDGYTTNDGVKVYSYATSNELSGSANDLNIFALDGIGTFAHEFGHVLGLDDLYITTSNVSNETPGYWDLMDSGVYNCKSNSYLNSSCTPPNFSAFERMSLGWLTPKKLASNDSIKTLKDLSKNEAFVLYDDNDEFFLIENRQQSKWDECIPGHGLLIWHIDYIQSVWEYNAINNTEGHPYVDIEEADDSYTASGDGGDSYPGNANVTSFTQFTTWGGTTLSPSLYHITETDRLLCFTTNQNIAVSSCESASVEPTALVFQGPGDTTQTIEQGKNIALFSFTWTGASGTTATGLPDGITTSVDAENRIITISGIVDTSAIIGVYHFTVSTLGGNPNATATGTISVTAKTLAIEHEFVIAQNPKLIRNGNELFVAGTGSKQLSLYTLDGKKIFTQDIQAGAVTISLAPFEGQGLLMARLTSHGKFLTQKTLLLP